MSIDSAASSSRSAASTSPIRSSATARSQRTATRAARGTLGSSISVSRPSAAAPPESVPTVSATSSSASSGSASAAPMSPSRSTNESEPVSVAVSAAVASTSRGNSSGSVASSSSDIVSCSLISVYSATASLGSRSWRKASSSHRFSKRQASKLNPPGASQSSSCVRPCWSRISRSGATGSVNAAGSSTHAVQTAAGKNAGSSGSTSSASRAPTEVSAPAVPIRSSTSPAAVSRTPTRSPAAAPNVASVPGSSSSAPPGSMASSGMPRRSSSSSSYPASTIRAAEPSASRPYSSCSQSVMIGSRSGVTPSMSWTASSAPSRWVNTRPASSVGSHTHRSSTNCLAGHSVSRRSARRTASGSATPLSSRRRAMSSSLNGPCSARILATAWVASNASATVATLCRGQPRLDVGHQPMGLASPRVRRCDGADAVDPGRRT
ncbi:Uncharacterised protein [Mycobacterium tuberculosis]|nr:Uncharacterised protein [Mycobacterium tuberculosis]